MGDTEIFENLNKAINYPLTPKMHIYTKHFYVVYFITLDIYYFLGTGYRNGDFNKLYHFFFCLMRMGAKFNGSAWKNWNNSNLLTKINMNFSFIQKWILVRKLLQFGLIRSWNFEVAFAMGICNSSLTSGWFQFD